MGKKGGNSWLALVKRAFRSPGKGTKKPRSNGEDHEQEEQEKKREKRRWTFSTGSKGEEEELRKNPQTIFVATPLNKEYCAAIVIQRVFRGYLARRALKALKGLVKLQAVVRGQNVRSQVNIALRCMRVLTRVQERVREQKIRLEHEGSRKSLFSDYTSFGDSQILHDITERTPMSTDQGSNWDDRRYAFEEIKTMIQGGKEDVVEKELSYPFFNHIWRSRQMLPSISQEELERFKHLENLKNRARASIDHREHIKTVEIDTIRSLSHSPQGSQKCQQKYDTAAVHKHLVTPSPAKVQPIQVRSASPRCSTPIYSINKAEVLPNYMAATESAKARFRSQSAPKQRPLTPGKERNVSARKRLSFPVPEGNNGSRYSQSLRSPSFKCACDVRFCSEHQSNTSSTCTDILVGGTSSSAIDCRRWMR